MNQEQYRIHIFQRGAPVTLTLILINCVIYGGQFLLGPAQNALVIKIFGLSMSGISNGAYWQFLTYAFLHGGILHLTLNMVGLWFVGREVEILLGGGKYLFLYFMGGIIGGLAQVLIAGSAAGAEIIGASGCVFAVMITFTTLYPNVVVTALIFFVLPLRMKAKYLGGGIVLLTILFWLSGMEQDTAHLTHLGGCAVGFALGLLWRKDVPPFPSEDDESLPFGQAPVMPPPLPPGPPTEIQKVLDKIVGEGFGSLSAVERDLLETYRSQLSRRGDLPKSELD